MTQAEFEYAVLFFPNFSGKPLFFKIFHELHQSFLRYWDHHAHYFFTQTSENTELFLENNVLLERKLFSFAHGLMII